METHVDAWLRRPGDPDPYATPPRAAKPRGSLDDAVRARRECVPCREAAAAAGLPAAAEAWPVAPRPWENLDWLARRAAAGRDPAADLAEFATPPTVDPGGPVYGWLHVAVLGDWRAVLGELLSQADRSG